MEKKGKIKKEVKRKIDDIRNKVKTTKEKLENEENPSAELKKTVTEMENASKNLDEIYESIKEKIDIEWDKIEKNIFQNINSFDNLFTKAETMFTGKSEK